MQKSIKKWYFRTYKRDKTLIKIYENEFLLQLSQMNAQQRYCGGILDTYKVARGPVSQKCKIFCSAYTWVSAYA